MTRHPKREGIFVVLLFGLSVGCGAKLDYPVAPQFGTARKPEINIDPSGTIASTEISVLIYNVTGLPWPLSVGKRSRTMDESGERISISSDRTAAMREIGDRLGEMRNRGEEPDIIMLQEAFIEAAAEIPKRGGYPNWVSGPSASDLGEKYSADRVSEEFIAERSFWKGETLGKYQNSGLIIASNFPIVKHVNHPFNQWECTGFDCLANKGVTLIEVAIPGIPESLQVTTTHFNSRGASGVSRERSRIAHAYQVDDASEFLEDATDYDLPEIWGGDLNMRHSDDRIEYFIKRAGGKVDEVSSFCVIPENDCDVRIQWKTDAPWYETQDLQGWFSGKLVEVRPVSVTALFDVPTDSVMQSDHDGLLVRYRLSWAVSD